MSGLGMYARNVQTVRKVKRAVSFSLLTILVASFTILPYAHFFTQSAYAADTVTTNTLPFSTMETTVASQDGTHIVAATSDPANQVYTSDDSGATWTAHSLGGSGDLRAMVATADGQTIMGIYGSRMYRSVDGGVTWSHTSDTTHAWTALSYAPGTGTLYGIDDLNGADAINKSTDFGQTWTAIYTPSSGLSLNSVSVSRDGTRLYDVLIDNTTFATTVNLSTDDGATWTLFHQSDNTNNVDYAIYANGENSLALIDVYPLAGNVDDTYLVSTDSGATWNTMATPVPAAFSYSSFYFTPPNTYNYTVGTTLYHVKTPSSAGIVSSATVGGQSLDNNPTISAQPSFSGVAQPFAQVTVTVHSDPVTCTTTADSLGAWSCQLLQALPAGSHTVLIDFVNQDASTDELGPYTVTVPSTGSTNTTPGNTPSSAPKKTAPAGVLADDTPIVATNTDQTPPVTDTTPTPTTNDTIDTQKPSATSSFNWWVVLVPVILAVVIIAVVVIARRSRN